MLFPDAYWRRYRAVWRRAWIAIARYLFERRGGDPTIRNRCEYHWRELAIALQPDEPRHSLPHIACGDRVLDIGCGAGQTLIAACPYRVPTHELSERNGRPGCVTCQQPCDGGWAFGVDIDATAVHLGTRWSDRIRFSQARAESLPFPDAFFDVVISRVALPYTDIAAAVREIRRVLRSGGRAWLMMHPVSYLVERAGQGGWISKLGLAYVLMNGLLFHLTLRTLKIMGRCESWQSESAMRRVLGRSGFRLLEVQRHGRCFSVMARAPTAADSDAGRSGRATAGGSRG